MREHKDCVTTKTTADVALVISMIVDYSLDEYSIQHVMDDSFMFETVTIMKSYDDTYQVVFREEPNRLMLTFANDSNPVEVARSIRDCLSQRISK